MTLKELRELIDIVYAREAIEEFEIEKAGTKLRIRRQSNHGANAHGHQALRGDHALPERTIAPTAPTAPPVPETEQLHYITAPILGTFYAAPGPDTSAFVSVGDPIEKGRVVCIIEAMKLMNEIESDIAGMVVKVLAQNGQPVEFGQRLFAIRPH